MSGIPGPMGIGGASDGMDAAPKVRNKNGGAMFCCAAKGRGGVWVEAEVTEQRDYLWR